MILRLFVLLIACIGLTGRAGAVSVLRLQQFSPLETVQNRDEQRDIWRSPQNSLKTFPFLGQEDCALYGRKNGYSECAGAPPEEPASAAEATPEPAVAQERELVEPPVPMQPPLPVRRVKILGDKAAPPTLGSGAISEAPPAAGAPVDDHFAKTVGALLVVSFEGRSGADDGAKRVASALRQGRVGGVLLRRANITSAAQLKALTAFLSAGQDQPPLILIEHSGGPDDALARIAGFQPVASPRELGAQGDALEAFNIYQQTAENLATVGVSLNVGPRATDCPHNASAATMDCFGSDPRHSAAFATAFNLAHQSRGILTAMPYQAAAGGDAIALKEMAKRKAPDALIVSAQTANTPRGTAAAKTLRPEGFPGTILVDSIDQQDAADTLVGALNRGADMVLFRTASGLATGLPEKALAGIRTAVDAGRLPPARLDAAVRHAASLRQQLQASHSRITSGAGSAGQSSPKGPEVRAAKEWRREWRRSLMRARGASLPYASTY